MRVTRTLVHGVEDKGVDTALLYSLTWFISYLRPAHEVGEVDCIKRRGVGRSEGAQVRVRVRGSDGVKS